MEEVFLSIRDFITDKLIIVFFITLVYCYVIKSVSFFTSGGN